MNEHSALTKLQASFQAYLLDEDAQSSFESHAITAQIVSDAKVGIQKRLGIYYDAYRLRIIEALATSYPKLNLLLGDVLFNQIARSYITQFPSTYQNMRWYGAKMQTHLQNTLPEHPIAAEMAAFEWALSLAFDAEDTPTITLEDLAAVPPETWGSLKFYFQPSLQILHFKWNIIAIWKALNEEETPPDAAQTSEEMSCLVWRKTLNAHYVSIASIELSALHLALSPENNRGSFGEICDFLMTHNPSDMAMSDEEIAQQAMATAAQYLASWIQEGMIKATVLIEAS